MNWADCKKVVTLLRLLLAIHRNDCILSKLFWRSIEMIFDQKVPKRLLLAVNWDGWKKAEIFLRLLLTIIRTDYSFLRLLLAINCNDCSFLRLLPAINRDDSWPKSIKTIFTSGKLRWLKKSQEIFETFASDKSQWLQQSLKKLQSYSGAFNQSIVAFLGQIFFPDTQKMSNWNISHILSNSIRPRWDIAHNLLPDAYF